MGESAKYIADKRYVKDDPAQKPDYGWRFQGKIVLLHEDNCMVCDDSVFEMESVLRQMSLTFSSLDNCLQCGICSSRCSNSLISANGNLSPRELIQLLRLGLLDLSGPELWFCTNCGGCTTNCPSEVPLIDVIISLRNLVFAEGAGYFPTTVKSALSSVKAFNNPWKGEPGKRSDWLDEIGIQTSRDPESILLFVGCSPSYDPRTRGIAKAAAKLMCRMGVAFDILAGKEVCCGDNVMRVGDFDTFDKLRKVNSSNIESSGVRNVYTLSPHCFHTMKTNYFETSYDSSHIKPFLILLHDKLKTGSLIFSRKIHKRITYHDPCFLAKHNSIYDEPREILDSIEGLSVVEMDHNRKGSLCCGGGGGGIWLDHMIGERLGDVRLDEALSLKAEVVVTACPHCLSMLEDAAQGNPKYQDIKIMDICELVLEAL